MRILPVSEAETRVTLGFCFPRDTVARPRFNEEVAAYVRRWHIAVSEDNESATTDRTWDLHISPALCRLKRLIENPRAAVAVSENQQRGLCSLHHKPGRFVPTLEAIVHRFNNWLLDQVLA